MYRYLALAVLVLPTFVHADAESQLSRPFELRPAWNKALGPGYSGCTSSEYSGQSESILKRRFMDSI